MPTAKQVHRRPSSAPGRNRDSKPDDGALVSARGLTKRYGPLVAVDSLDLDLRAGEVYGLLGPNGAGKTTTILMLLGLTEPTAGRVHVLGLDPARDPLGVKRQVGYLPDNAGFYGNLTGRENLRFTARLNGLRRDEAEERIDHVLDQVGLTEPADRRVDQYSRGMRQRLGIADALVKDPLILILDEPTIAIDPIGVAEILSLVRRLVDEQGIGVLLASHLLDQVQSVCDRVGIFSAGRLIGQGTLDDLVTRFGDGLARIEVGVELGGSGGGRREAATALLRGVARVVDVAEARGSQRGAAAWTVTVAPAAAEGAVRGAIGATLLGAGFMLSTLRAVPHSLDEIYRSAVGTKSPPAGPGQAVPS